MWDSDTQGGILEPGVGFWSLWWDPGTQGGILMPRMDFWSPGWDSRSGLFIIKQGKCPTAGGHGPSDAAASLVVDGGEGRVGGGNSRVTAGTVQLASKVAVHKGNDRWTSG